MSKIINISEAISIAFHSLIIISRSKKRISVYETIEGKIEIHDCVMDYEECKFNNCVFSNLTDKVSNEFLKYLKDHTIANFII